ncbi:ester cyclase [Acinetobacter guillouiae]|uniref:ester cyclase n=1 Tax=Acinetobacter guillouiae TaxID=106649 RepID=UPI003AF485A4
MSSNLEENKTLVRRFFAAIEIADFQTFDQIVAVDYNDHLPRQSRGREVLKQYFSGLHAAFSNLKLPISEILAEGDKVAVLNSVRGTHKGDFLGLKATGRNIDAMAFQLYRIENGQLAEHWEIADFTTLLQQLKA